MSDISTFLNGKQRQTGGGGGQTADQVRALILADSPIHDYGTAFPTSPPTHSVFIFKDDEATISGAQLSDGTAVTSAKEGDVFKYNGTAWILIYRFDSFVNAFVNMNPGSFVFATGTAYKVGNLVVSGNELARVATAIPESNTDDFDTLVTAGTLTTLSSASSVSGVLNDFFELDDFTVDQSTNHTQSIDVSDIRKQLRHPDAKAIFVISAPTTAVHAGQVNVILRLADGSTNLINSEVWGTAGYRHPKSEIIDTLANDTLTFTAIGDASNPSNAELSFAGARVGVYIFNQDALDSVADSIPESDERAFLAYIYEVEDFSLTGTANKEVNFDMSPIRKFLQTFPDAKAKFTIDFSYTKASGVTGGLQIVLDDNPDHTSIINANSSSEYQSGSTVANRHNQPNYIEERTSLHRDSIRFNISSSPAGVSDVINFTDVRVKVILFAESSSGTAQTGSQIVSLLEALPSGSRLSFNSLDDRPTIPTDTTIFFGPYASNTAIPANRIVTHNNGLWWTNAAIPSSNTDAPGTNTNFEQFDIGSPNDITNLSISSNVITVTRRSGTTFTITLPSSSGGTATLSQDNFPSTDPADGTLLFFNDDQSTFTASKTVRNEADDADVTSAIKGTLFKYFSTGTKWIRQFTPVDKVEPWAQVGTTDTIPQSRHSREVFEDLGDLDILGFAKTAAAERAYNNENFAGRNRTGDLRVESYLDVHGKLYTWEVPSAGGLCILADLITIDNAADRSVVGGSAFHIANTGTGVITFEIGGIGRVFPDNASIPSGGVALLAIEAVGGASNTGANPAFQLITSPHDDFDTPFKHKTSIASWIRYSTETTVPTGRYFANADTLVVRHHDRNNVSRVTELGNIEVGFAIGVGDKYFVVKSINTALSARYVFSGYWHKGEQPTVGAGIASTFAVIDHDTLLGAWSHFSDIQGRLATSQLPTAQDTFNYISSLIAAADDDTVPFASVSVGNWEKETWVDGVDPPSGHYQVIALDRIEIHHTDNDSNDQQAVLEAIQVGQGIRVGTATFVVTAVTTETDFVNYTGYWRSDAVDQTAHDSVAAIGRITHNLLIEGYLKLQNLIGKLQLSQLFGGTAHHVVKYDSSGDGSAGLIENANVADGTLGIGKLADGTGGKVVGFDETTNEPAELDLPAAMNNDDVELVIQNAQREVLTGASNSTVSGIAEDADGDVWTIENLFSPADSVLRKYNKITGAKIGNDITANTGNDDPAGLAFVPTATPRLWALDTDGNSYRYNPSDGSYIDAIAVDSAITSPAGIAHDIDVGRLLILQGGSSGAIYTANEDTGANTAKLFDLDSAQVLPRDLIYIDAVEPEIWVLDELTSGNPEIFRYKVDGTLIGRVDISDDTDDNVHAIGIIDGSPVQIWIGAINADRFILYNLFMQIKLNARLSFYDGEGTIQRLKRSFEPVEIYAGTLSGDDSDESLIGGNTFSDKRLIIAEWSDGITATISGAAFRAGRVLGAGYDNSNKAQITYIDDTSFSYDLTGTFEDLVRIYGVP